MHSSWALSSSFRAVGSAPLPLYPLTIFTRLLATASPPGELVPEGISLSLTIGPAGGVESGSGDMYII